MRTPPKPQPPKGPGVKGPPQVWRGEKSYVEKFQERVDAGRAKADLDMDNPKYVGVLTGLPADVKDAP